MHRMFRLSCVLAIPLGLGCDAKQPERSSGAPEPASHPADPPPGDGEGDVVEPAERPANPHTNAKFHPGQPLDPLDGENHFGALRQLTNGGENAEAYLSFDESKLIFQSTRGDQECDQIFVMGLDGSNPTRVSSGKGRTTCAYFMPKDEKILYASTHAADDGCLPPPDRSLGYVWKLYDEYDIYVANADGSDPEVLSASKGYDAEATVSPKGDRIVFTSTRDGDPELYTMAIDGSDVKRLTDAPGYDGGAFFSLDGTKIVWRANRPEGEEELAKYQEIRDKGLVRPTRLELFVMNADGSEKRQITKSGAASFAPFWHPDGKHIIYASNAEDPKGRNFDLYFVAAEPDAKPERVTQYGQFDGFPMFTRDGKKLVFASNRNNANSGDTNVFVADWVE